MRLCLSLALAFFVPAVASAKNPDCTNWPTNMAFVYLKNAGLTDNLKTDPSKATAVLLASEKVGKNLYKQVYRIIFRVKSGSDIEVITSNHSSHEECSMSAVDVFVVSRHLGDK